MYVCFLGSTERERDREIGVRERAEGGGREQGEGGERRGKREGGGVRETKRREEKCAGER